MGRLGIKSPVDYIYGAFLPSLGIDNPSSHSLSLNGMIHNSIEEIPVTFYFMDQFSLLTSCLLTCILLA